MKKAIAMTLLGLSVSLVHADETAELQLEPCVNGAVSASGLFPSQDWENRAVQQELEPAMNGLVSATGRYPTQQEEDAALGRW